MASGPCLRRCRVVRRYMPIRLQFYRLDVKAYPSIHVSMYCESFWEGNAVNTGVPCLKVPMHRKLRSAHLAAQGFTALLLIWDTASWHRSHAVRHGVRQPNQQGKQGGAGGRIVVCHFPSTSP